MNSISSTRTCLRKFKTFDIVVCVKSKDGMRRKWKKLVVYTRCIIKLSSFRLYRIRARYLSLFKLSGKLNETIISTNEKGKRLPITR